MPILKKGTFVKKSIPENLRPEDEILYCTMTQEIFTDYDEFFDRIILCNSLVWACSATGRSGLTYKEALQSEEHVRQQLKEFPDYLQKPVLFLVTMTHRKKINDVVDDVFSFSKDHYFVGETVEAYETSKVKKSYKVLKVLDAKKDNSPSCEKENTNEVNKQQDKPEDKKIETSKESEEKNEILADKSPSNDIINGLRKSPRKPLLTAPALKSATPTTTTEPQMSCYEYVLQEISSVITGVKILNGAKLSRRKGLYTKERCKTFIRAHCENKEGIWRVKEAGEQRYKLNSLSFSSFFPGDPPIFDVHKPPSSVIDLTSEDKKAKSDEAKMKALKNDIKHANKQDMQKLEGELRKMKETAAEKKEAKMKQMKSEQSMRQKEVRDCLDWIKARDDLLCDDLKDLPRSLAVDCEGVSNSRFGDMVFVVEFIMKFKSLLSISAPKSFNIELFHRSLMETNPQGLYSSLLQSFVAFLLNIHSQEISCYKIDFNKEEENASDESMFIKTIKQSYIDYGTGLHKLLLDDFTVSEVVKNYLKGMQVDESPTISRILQCSCVFVLSADDKLYLMHLLAHHLLSTSVVREFLDESSERIKVLSRELKMHQLNVAKREKDEAQYWSKKKQEGSLKAFLQGDKEELGDQDLKRKSNRRSEVVEKIPDEYFSQLPTSNLDWDKVAKNERDQLKAWEKRKEEELTDELSNLSESRSLPVAYDRTHRRFWLFNCLPGVFVEDDDSRIGLKAASKLKLVSQNPNSRNLKTLKQFLKGQEKMDKKLIDYVNSIQAVNSSTNLLASPSNDSVKNDTTIEQASEQECAMISALEQVNTKCQVRWSFYHTKRHLNLLLAGLNMRGFRESVLFKELKALQSNIEEKLGDEKKVRNALKFISPAIRKEADNTPNTSLKEDAKEGKNLKEEKDVNEEKSLHEKKDVKEEEDFKEGSKNAKVCETKETELKEEKVTKEDPLESFFIESLLDLEDRIFSGSLGNIKATTREEWRKDVEDKNYRQLFSYLYKENGKTVKMEVNDLEQEDLMMKGLSAALISVEQMMDARFLHGTLGFNAKKVTKFVRAVMKGDVKEEEDAESDDEKSSTASTINSKEAQATSNNNAPKKNLFIEYWELKVKSCQNISQLFIYMSVLDSNILWSKSALHACCRICRRQRNPELMLLCDMCDKGHHTFCLKPPVQSIPEGDWFCPWCKPSEIISPARTRSNKQENVDEDEEEEEEESEVNDDSDQDEDGEEVITKNFYRKAKAKNSKTNGHSSSKNKKKQKEAKKNKNSAKKKDIKNKRRTNYYEDSDDNNEDDFDDKTDSGNDKCEESNEEEEDNNYKLRKRSSVNGECDSGKKSKSSLEGSETKRTSRNSSNTASPSSSLTTLTLSPLAVRLSIPQCKLIIDKIVSLEDSWPFLEPVSKKEVPDYLDIIKRPMDFSTVKKKLNQNAYQSASEVISDVVLIFENCKCYNEPSTVFYKLADKLNKILEKEMKSAVANSDNENKGMDETEESKLSNSAESKKSSASKLSNGDDKLYPIFNSDSKESKKKVSKRKRVEDVSDDEENEEEKVQSSRKRVRCL